MEESTVLRPFMRWAGGKQNLVRYLLENIPRPEIINKYWEPFLGAGSLFFASNFKKAEISDVNEHLINSYKYIKKSPLDVFIKLKEYEKNFNSDSYYYIRQKFNSQKDQKTLDQAARFIFLVHTCFNGIYRVNRNGDFNVPIGKLNPSLPTIEHLKK